MDELAMMLLTVPILLPVLDAYEINLVWFGVFLILLCEVGMVVPPVGLLSFVVHGIAQDPQVNLGHRISLVDVFRGVFWFVVIAIALIVFLIFEPGLVTWLPNLTAD
jgi:TRAP-type C4-dicarboxylate transport system permease large subunit